MSIYLGIEDKKIIKVVETQSANQAKLELQGLQVLKLTKNITIFIKPIDSHPLSSYFFKYKTTALGLKLGNGRDLNSGGHIRFLLNVYEKIGQNWVYGTTTNFRNTFPMALPDSKKSIASGVWEIMDILK